jgi:hypothetical protein
MIFGAAADLGYEARRTAITFRPDCFDYSGALMTHPDDRIRRLLRDCPFLIDRVDLEEGPYYITYQIAESLGNGKLSDAEAASLFGYFNKMAGLDLDTQNLLVVGVLEVLTDTPQWIARTRAGLDGGPARFLFERVLEGWY